VLLCAGVVQWVLVRLVLPNLPAMIAVVGGLGLVVATLMFALHARHSRQLELELVSE
jgi:hypothetical protein